MTMKMNDRVRQLLNDQIAHEFQAAYTYLAIAAHFEAENFEGFAKWMRVQAKEETEHAMKLFDYLVERGERISLGSLDAPKPDYGTPLDAFRTALEHERKVTGQINAIYEAAGEAKDYPTVVMLQWFIGEQVEEENLTGTAVDQLERAGDNKAALLFLDGRFGARAGGH
jgi:ferritin